MPGNAGFFILEMYSSCNNQNRLLEENHIFGIVYKQKYVKRRKFASTKWQKYGEQRSWHVDRFDDGAFCRAGNKNDQYFLLSVLSQRATAMIFIERQLTSCPSVTICIRIETLKTTAQWEREGAKSEPVAPHCSTLERTRFQCKSPTLCMSMGIVMHSDSLHEWVKDDGTRFPNLIVSPFLLLNSEQTCAPRAHFSWWSNTLVIDVFNINQAFKIISLWITVG
jgi:hypothetical protein